MGDNMLGAHWIPEHRGPEDREAFKRLGLTWIKIVTVNEQIPYLEDLPPSVEHIIVRYHPMSELFEHRTLLGLDIAALGRQQAETCDRIARWAEAHGWPRSKSVFEGINEPHYWAPEEAPELVTALELARLHRNHELCLGRAYFNPGVGWPGNGGGVGAPMDDAFMAPVCAAFGPNDYLGSHEYWWLDGPSQNWKWWAGRFTQSGFTVPRLITECGMDQGVTQQGALGGWRNLPGSTEDQAREYVAMLTWYAAMLRADGRVKAFFPFTYDMGSNHWQFMNVRDAAWVNEAVRQLSSFEAGPVIAPPPPVVVVPPAGGTLPENEPATDALTLAVKLRWWLEESQRSLELGQATRAGVLVRSMVKLADRIVKALTPTPIPTPALTQYSQRDTRWGSLKLGTGTLTIAEAGCLLCAGAAGMTDRGAPFSPSELNAYLNGHNGYASGNLFVWRAIEPLGFQFLGLVSCATVPAPVDNIRRALTAGDLVVVQVDAVPGGDLQEHWLLVEAAVGEDFTVMDPMREPGQTLGLLTKLYGVQGWSAARVIVGVATYKRVVP